MSIEVWLVRHGRTEANKNRIIQGHTDTELDEIGHKQARALGAHLAKVEASVDRLIASPLVRAQTTARLVGEPLGLTASFDERWMERGFGILEGTDASTAYDTMDAAGGDPLAYRPEGGESTHDMAARVRAALDDLAGVQERNIRIMVVTHGGPIGAAVAYALGLSFTGPNLRRFRRDNTGISVLSRREEPGPPHWVVRTLNARPHLPPLGTSPG